ncbi:MAG TPA: branched-chain amino acid ABC transporter permease [Chloroflexi bacterium]|jgi:branched-chain amino acid transport system permease protein|nr:branched-chain amino acid ABC transporter permease [Chloroflexota bacterium]HAF20503.1 branched-chain amino acid ABC transporter permease [Chloroflexota bacterium]
MLAFIQQIVSGIASGGIYASLALALVLVYRAMDVANFAQGEMATFSTFISYSLIEYAHLDFWTAFVITIVASFALGIGIERLLIRPFEGAPVLTLVIVTLGLFTIINGVTGLVWGYVFKEYRGAFISQPVRFGGLYLDTQDLGVLAVVLVMLLLLYLFFSRTKIGLAMRAASLYPESSRLLGVRVGWMLALGWGLAAAVGAVSGMMVAPIIFLDPNMMQSILLFAFAAAVLGGIESPLGSVVGGIAIGIVMALVGTYIPGGQDLRLAFGLIVIVVVLLVRPAGLFGRAAVRRV